jgi:hypothetical protein
MDPDESRRRIAALKAELVDMSVADQIYWKDPKHSREASAEYHQRIERLKEIRRAMATWVPGKNNIQ